MNRRREKKQALARAIERMTEFFGCRPNEKEVEMVANAISRHLDEPDAPSTRLQ
jgi:hypothetical protein